MKIEKNKVASLSYELEVEGQIADKAGAEAPLEYIHGTGMLLPKFEAAVEDKEPGDSFEFTLSAEEGYGEYHPEYVVTIPKQAFAIDGQVREDLLVIGRMIPMMNQDGQVMQGIVANVLDDSVAMDFNHPMAGKVLHFTGKVEAVRDATEKELLEGLHGEYLPPEEGHCKRGEGKGCCHGKGKGEGHCHEHGEGEGCCHGEGHGEGCCHE